MTITKEQQEKLREHTPCARQDELLKALNTIARGFPVDNLDTLLDTGRPMFGDLKSAELWPLILSTAINGNKSLQARGTPGYDFVKEQQYLSTLRENLKLFY
ncbi:hypothetical protein GOV03_04310 [Candidatus Woesearchaeota archaeon]|nr:hypothetical protein [Candidatus Woesearchaeota archaeon]